MKGQQLLTLTGNSEEQHESQAMRSGAQAEETRLIDRLTRLICRPPDRQAGPWLEGAMASMGLYQL